MTEKETKLENFKKSLENLTLEQLEALEQDVIKEANELDKEAADKTFVLKDKDGNELKVAKRHALGNMVASFIGRMETTWQQALVLKVIVDFWKSKSNEIKFPLLDNTLRLLGQVKFTGLADIDHVVEVNNLFENNREEFVEFSSKLFDVAERHQAILNAMDMLKPVKKNETQE